MQSKVAIAIGAHPDDIEFYMAGTLLMLKQAGYEIHYLTVANGNCGSAQYNAAMTRSIRNAEARAAAKILGAHFHPSLTNDLEILYNLELLRALAAVIREVKPGIVLTHSPQDYMEDHTNTSRLAVTAAFTRGMPNFKTVPPRPTADYDVTVYHAHAARPVRSVAAADHPRRVREHDFGAQDPAQGARGAQEPAELAGCQPGDELLPAGDWKTCRWRSGGCRRSSSTPRAGGGICISAIARPTPTRWPRRWERITW